MIAKITEYGKLLRNLRMDYGELLKDMSDKLKMSSSYLSAIESGKRNIPKDLTKKLATIYNLDDDMISRMYVAEMRSIREVTLNLENASDETHDVAIAFAKKLNTMDKQTIKILKQYLK